MKGAIMSRMLMALGVVAALGILPTEVSAAPLFPYPSAAVASETIVPGNACLDVLGAGTLVFSTVENSITATAATQIICPLPRQVSSSGQVTVTLVGIFPPLACQVVISNTGIPVGLGILGNSTPTTVPVNSDSSLSVQCAAFGTLATDVIRLIRVKT
jgi:hypothetical protein